MGVMTEPCGGCGESNPKKACIGCLHFHAPTTRETADHIGEANEKVDHVGDAATMIDHAGLLARAKNWVAEMGEFDDLDPIRAEAYIHGSFLLSEIAALRGEVASLEIRRDFFKHNMTQAERQRDELRKALEDMLREYGSDYNEECIRKHEDELLIIRRAREVFILTDEREAKQ